MTQNNFILSSSGSFSTASNWSLGHVPNTSEDADIDSTGGFAVLTGAAFVNSIGTVAGDGVLVDDGGELTALSGTGPNANDGSISVVDGYLFLGNGTFDNPGTIDLAGVTASAVGNLAIEGSLTLKGGGAIAMAIGAPGSSGPADNLIFGFNFSTTPTLLNLDNTISGDGTVEGLNFINDGFIETNNSSSTNGGLMQIVGDSTGESGSFTNNSYMMINSGGEFLFGQNGNSSIILNYGGIVFQADSKFTTLAVTGNVTIGVQQTGMGQIQMEGQTPSDNRIITLGQPAILTLGFQTLDGAGTIGDGDLTLIIEGGAIEADLPNEILTLNTGTNRIDSEGTLTALQGGELDIDSSLQSSGQIDAVGGTIVLAGAVLLASPGATVGIGQNGIVITESTISANVTFTGTQAELEIRNGLANGGIGGEIVGATVTDSIDFSEISFSAGNHLHWQQTSAGSGTLSLVSSSGATLASVTLAGSFTTSDFSASTAADGGTLATVVGLLPAPAPDDFNADRISDLLWRDSSTESLVTWLMNGSAIASSAFVTSGGGAVAPDSSWSMAGLGDFNGDGDADMLWRQSSTGSLVTWLMNGSAITSSAFVTSGGSALAPDSSWSVAGIGDFNGDDDADMLWRQSTTGSLVVWLMNGSAVASSTFVTSGGNAVTLDSTWSTVGVGDFNGDGDTDVLWRQSTTGSLVDWTMNGSTIASSAFVTSGGSAVAPDASWSVVAVGDFNGDGADDVLWRQSATGSLVTWLMNGPAIASSAFVTSGGNPVAPDSTWNIVEVGDFNGTNRAGILWQQSTTGTLAEWQMNGPQIVSSQTVTSGGTPIAPASTWQVQANPTDFV